MQMNDTSGGLAGFGGATQGVDRCQVLEHNRGWNATALPVVDSLSRAGLLVEAEQARESDVAA